MFDAFRRAKISPFGVLRDHNRQAPQQEETDKAEKQQQVKEEEPAAVKATLVPPPRAAIPAGSWPSIETLARLSEASRDGEAISLDLGAVDEGPAALTRNALLLTILTAAATTTSGDLRARLFFMLFQVHVAPVLQESVHARLTRLVGTTLTACESSSSNDDDGGGLSDDDEKSDESYVSFKDMKNNGSPMIIETLCAQGDELDAALQRGFACVNLGARKRQVAGVCLAWLNSPTTAQDCARHFRDGSVKGHGDEAFLNKCRRYGVDPLRTGRREYELWMREKRVGLPRRYGNASVWDCEDLDFSGEKTGDLRFAIGESVRVYLGTEGWFSGKIVDFYYREKDWDDDDVAPYQIALDDDPRLIFAPEDDDALIKPSERTKRTKTGNPQRPNLTFLDACGHLPHTTKGTKNNPNLLPLDHLFDLAANFGINRGYMSARFQQYAERQRFFGLDRDGRCDSSASASSSSDKSLLAKIQQKEHPVDNNCSDDASSSSSSGADSDDAMPCLFDLVKKIYGHAAETFLRHNVRFDFGHGATIDTSLALIHVRRVDLSRALSSQLFAKKKHLHAPKAAKQQRKKKISHAKKKNTETPTAGNHKMKATGCCCNTPHNQRGGGGGDNNNNHNKKQALLP